MMGKALDKVRGPAPNDEKSAQKREAPVSSGARISGYL